MAPKLNIEQKSYKRIFQQSWLELEKEFQNGNVNPRHENDVVCYLYYALANAFKKKGFPLYFIRTEDTINFEEESMRPDLNLNNRVFVEVKMYGLSDYRRGWEKRQQNIEYTADKLRQYVAYQRSTSSVLVRHPILAIWFKKRENSTGRSSSYSKNDFFLSEDLEKKLNIEKRKYAKEITLLYGPRKP